MKQSVLVSRIQQSLNFSAFEDLMIVEHGSEGLPMAEHFNDVDPFTAYTFSVIANRKEFGKTVRGLPGPSSPVVRLLDYCYGKHIFQFLRISPDISGYL